MGNAASALGNRTIYIIGAVVITIAKPACEYTARLVARSTNEKLDEICKRLSENEGSKAEKLNNICKRLSDSEAFEEKLDKLNIEEKLDEICSKFSAPSLEEKLDEIYTKLGKIDDLSYRLAELEQTTRTDVASIKEAIRNTDISVVRVYDIVDKHEEITKKYSMYLHDEHTQMYEAISKSTPRTRLGAEAKRKKAASMSLPPSPRGENAPLHSALNKKAASASLVPSPVRGMSAKPERVVGGVGANV